MAAKMVKIDDVPAGVLRKVNADARARNVSVNDSVVGVLAGMFGVTHTNAGRFTAPAAGPMLNLRMSPDLHRLLKTHSASTGVPMRQVVVNELAKHHGLAPPGRKAA